MPQVDRHVHPRKTARHDRSRYNGICRCQAARDSQAGQEIETRKEGLDEGGNNEPPNGHCGDDHDEEGFGVVVHVAAGQLDTNGE